MSDHSHSALLVVDSQTGAITSNFWGTARSNPSYERNVTKILSAFRSFPKSHESPHIIHIYHSSLNASSPLHASSAGMSFHTSSLPQEGEPVISKSSNSAFITPELEKLLREREIWKVYFIGLSVDLCLGSTIRSASDLGVADHTDEEGNLIKGDIILVEDATAAWAKKDGKFDAETVHGVHVESLKGEFARILSTEQVVSEMGYHGIAKTA
jgi:nicotinamidase-related amidase